MRWKKTKTGFLLAVLIVSSLLVQTSFIKLKDNSMNKKTIGDLHQSGVSEVTKTRQWIINGDFSSSDNWTSEKGMLGDPDDVDGSITAGYANYQVLGSEDQFTFEEKYYMGSSWVITNHPDYPVDPTFGNIVAGEGFRAGHSWNDQSANQVPSVQWERNFSLPVNMSDYVITSASVSAGVNATVDTNIDTVGDGVAGRSARTGVYPIDTYSVGDYIRFYVSISNLQKTKTHEIAHTQSATLGDGDAGLTADDLAQQLMSTVSQADLIYYTSSVLDTDYRNFTLIVGIRFNCEDNLATQFDLDDFTRAVINSINFNFTYERIIDQQTSISWKQEGDKPSDIITNPFVIDKAILNFTYNVNDTLPQALSPNSEIRILINGFPHSETIKLWTAETTFQNASLNGFDLTRLIDKDKNINVSIRVYLADEFKLNRTITFSIDDIYLNVTYTEDVTDIETKLQLFLDGIDRTDEPVPVISLPLGVDLNITVKYTNLTGEYIPLANVNLEGKVSGIFDPDPSFQQYNITINTNDLGIGVSVLTIIAQKPFYETNQTQFYVEVTERETELLLYLNGNPTNASDTFNAKVDETVNITVYFKDNETKQHLPDATVVLLGWDQLNETNNQYYNITINTNDLVKGINAFTIFAQLVNFTTNSINFFIEVYERETKYQLLLNNIDLTLNPFISLTFIETLNITVKYLDNETGNHITNATLDYIEIGGDLEGNLTEYETLELYSKKINGTDLRIGVSIINIIAQKNLYQTQNIQFSVEITERETELLLFLNGYPKNDGDSIIAEIVEAINVTIYYRDNITKEHIPNATVNLLNWNQLNETNYQYYNITIDAKDLDQGITILTIFAQKDNYQPQIIRFLIEVTERETEILLFINGDPKNPGDTIQVEIDDLINVSIYYRDNITKEHLPNATINLLGWDQLNESYNLYSILINASDLTQTITALTVFAQKNNYQPQTINFFIELVEKVTVLQLFLNGVLKNDGDTIQVEFDDTINIVIYYRDNASSEHIPGAIVNLLGVVNLDEIGNQYSTTINANDLEKGINAFTIIAQVDHYQSQSIRFFVELVEKATLMQLILNGDDITLDPVFNLTIGQSLNLTVRYTDQTGVFIPNATVLLIGEGLSLDLTKDNTFNQYYIILDTTDLGIGVKLFSIIAQKPNFQWVTKDLRITVNRISAEITTRSGVAQIEAEIGDNVLLEIVLVDNIFGTNITEAIVTYNWAYGQGELEDSDNDGIYEILLENVREGIHTITITAFAGDNYDFESYPITIVVIPPTTSAGPDLSWLIYILVGGIVGLVMIFTLYQTHFKYPPMVRKIRKLRKKVRKNKKTKPILLEGREDIIKSDLQKKIDAVEIAPIPAGESIPKDKMKIVKEAVNQDIEEVE